MLLEFVTISNLVNTNFCRWYIQLKLFLLGTIWTELGNSSACIWTLCMIWMLKKSKSTVKDWLADFNTSTCILQGFLPVESLILEIEVWGIGGRSAKQMQMSYKKREELFTEQRRKVIRLDHLGCCCEFVDSWLARIWLKVNACPSVLQVDLKKFASWEDSPEKMMMDMMSDPNAVRREDR